MAMRVFVSLLLSSVALFAACGKGESDNAGAGGSGASGGGSGASGGKGGESSAFDCTAPSGGTPALKLTEVASGFERPTFAISPPGDTSRIFVLEQAGLIQIVENGTRQATPFLDITTKVTRSANEQGLLGLAFHPDYAQNGRFYVHYSADPTATLQTGDTVVSEFRRASDTSADAASERVLFTVSQPESNHNGGMIAFGPDGFLYIGLGDGGGGGDQHGSIGNGQNTDTLLGKLLRIDVDSTSAGQYGIPSGNMTGAGVRPELWAYGLRNPWRFSFDGCTGDLWIGDVGQDGWEEIDLQPANRSGTNYGWRLKEGLECFNPNTGCDPSSATVAPVAVYQNDVDGCSVTGGYVYRGSAIPALRGAYLYADYCTGNFWMLRMQAGQPDVQKITSDINTGGVRDISSFGRDARGELYVLSLTAGTLYRIDPD
jgi:glucose/arabinose dehydrogenase